MATYPANQERIKRRQLQVLHGKVVRMKLAEIAKATGYSEKTIVNDIAELRKLGVTNDLIQQERNIHIKALPIATATILAGIMTGDVDTACKMMKGVGVWKENLEVTGKLEPSDMQKRMFDNMEKLLKLQPATHTNLKELPDQTSYEDSDHKGNNVCANLKESLPESKTVLCKPEENVEQAGGGTPTTHPAESEFNSPSHNLQSKTEVSPKDRDFDDNLVKKGFNG